MHRSSSYLSMSGGGGGRLGLDMDDLPTYDPQSDVAKKEATRARFAESMVHVIPLVLILCAAVLWFFSYPGTQLYPIPFFFFFFFLSFLGFLGSLIPGSGCRSRREVLDVGGKDDIIARIKNMTIDGYSNWNGTSMTIGMEDLDPIEGLGMDENGGGRELVGKGTDRR
ncbi:uncharacterized protein [Typha latifolia]|uniref:uncharacterized protein isoform X1 n=1 Tax=Typha latifolia TaxID=4733 RepID=UPI003C2D649C